jgi:hypothetical protein
MEKMHSSSTCQSSGSLANIVKGMYHEIAHINILISSEDESLLEKCTIHASLLIDGQT